MNGSQLSNLFTNEELSEMAPHRGLTVGSKTRAKFLRDKGFSVTETVEGWEVNDGVIRISCEDSTLFMEPCHV